MTRIGKYTAGMITAKATGNAASRPRPPRINQVSLPSQTGAIEFMITLRERESGAKPNSIAYTEIEAVQQDIKEYSETENQRPNRHQVENLLHRTSPFVALAVPTKRGIGKPFVRVSPWRCGPRPALISGN